MRVCFISFEYPPHILGGAGTYAEALVGGLRREGVEVFVIARGNPATGDRRTFRVPTSNTPYLRRLFFMRPALSLFHKLDKSLKFDVVHFNEPHIVLRRLGLPTVCTIHSSQINEIKLKLEFLSEMKTTTDIRDLILKSPFGSICDLLTAGATDKIICPSPHLAEVIASYCFVDALKIHVIPNGIDLGMFDDAKHRADVLDEYHLTGDDYVLFMGRLTYLKGIQFLVDAFNTLKKEYSNLKLVIAGTGDFENHLKGVTSGLRDVVFTGYVDSLEAKKTLYENSLVVVVPSLYEALPMVVLEAMACRKAVVASNVGSIPYLVKHGGNGFLSNPGDPSSLRKYIKTLLEDSNLRETFGLSGRKMVEEKFTVETMVATTLKTYESF